jgi:large subunit ribosomal protein L21
LAALFAFVAIAAKRSHPAGPNCKEAGRAYRLRAGLNTEKTMFAVIKTGGKQYKVAAEDEITVMTLAGEPGETVTFGEVLALFDGDTSHVGAPHVEGASVAGTIVAHKRGPKVYAFKKRRRKNSRRKRGHKQDLTVVKITGISAKAAS